MDFGMRIRHGGTHGNCEVIGGGWHDIWVRIL
jgi:hypothetical protein